MKKILLCVLFFNTINFLNAQDTIQNNKPTVDLSGYIDGYYAYDFSNPTEDKKLPFLYNYNKHNEFNVNMALLRVSVGYQNVYAKFSIQAGTYVDENYGAENVKLFNEAYLGIYLNQKRSTSLEFGIMPSYIGFETATSHMNLTATRSILAENCPYFITGVKVYHQFNDKISGAFLIMNGWQRIQKPVKNVTPAFGTQLQYKASENSLFNWSTFAGKEDTGFGYHLRLFNNVYFDQKWNDKWHTIAGFDFGAQKMSSADNTINTWYSPVLITQYAFSKKWQMAHRLEYYDDQHNVMIPYELPFQTFGNSINFDFLPNAKMKIRLEGKWYHASELVFNDTKDNVSLTTTMSFEF